MKLLVHFFLAQLLLVTAFQVRTSSAQAVHTVFFSYTSNLLTGFSGKKVSENMAMYVPPACIDRVPACPLMVHFPGYGTALSDARFDVVTYARLSRKFPATRMAHLYMDINLRGGYNYFTDSENNGPWNSALTQELIPYVEGRFHVAGASNLRFITGHSSGAWTATWVQVSNPSFFNGVWAVAPDPLDFRHFYNISVVPGSHDNFYFTPRHALRPLDREGNISMKELMQRIDDNPKDGGIISSYEFAWSPKGENGLPLRFFNRSTGALIQDTLQAWQNYDVHSVLEEGGDNLKSQLLGKINLFCGSLDDFFYNLPTSAMCSYLSANHFGGACKIISGRTHLSVFDPAPAYPRGLQYLIIARAAARAK